MKFSPATVGVIVAEVALVYDQLSMAFCPDMILGVVVVSQHVGGGFAITCKIPVQSAEDCALLTSILNV